MDARKQPLFVYASLERANKAARRFQREIAHFTGSKISLGRARTVLGRALACRDWEDLKRWTASGAQPSILDRDLAPGDLFDRREAIARNLIEAMPMDYVDAIRIVGWSEPTGNAGILRLIRDPAELQVSLPEVPSGHVDLGVMNSRAAELAGRLDEAVRYLAEKSLTYGDEDFEVEVPGQDVISVTLRHADRTKSGLTYWRNMLAWTEDEESRLLKPETLHALRAVWAIKEVRPSPSQSWEDAQERLALFVAWDFLLSIAWFLRKQPSLVTWVYPAIDMVLLDNLLEGMGESVAYHLQEAMEVDRESLSPIQDLAETFGRFEAIDE